LSTSKIVDIKIFIFTLLCVGFIVFFQVSTAHGWSENILSAWAYVTPTIDGVRRMGEWDDADSLSFTAYGGVDCVFYVKNDVSNIYFAVSTTDSTLSQGSSDTDQVWLLFDNDNDGFGPENGDDSIGWNGYKSEGFRDGFLDGARDMWNKDIGDGGTSDGSAAATGDGTHNFFEISHPLDSNDDAHDFSLSLGDTVRFIWWIWIDGHSSGYIATSSDWPNIEVARAPEPSPTPEPTPEATPEPTPEATPEPTPEATPGPPFDVTQVILALIGLVGTLVTAYFTYRVAIARVRTEKTSEPD